MGTNVSKYSLLAKQLLYLTEVVNHGSISRAAEVNDIKQPNLSALIKDLEALVQQPIIERHSKGVNLTDKGYEYYVKACQIKNILQEVENIPTANTKMFGNIRLWTSDGLASIYVSECFEQFYAKYPTLNISINCSLDMPQLSEFDMALLFHKPTAKSLMVIDSHKLKFSLYASAQYLKQHAIPKDAVDLQQNHHICNNATYLNKWREWNFICKHAQHTTTIMNSSSTLLHLITAGLGVGLLPISVAEKYDDLVEIKNIIPSLEAEFYLFMKRQDKQSHKIKALVDILNDSVSK
ncbi:MAG: LysR family transcriptional regulator [Alphaproteobacteria bacterium]|nr:LysR family transcriptional regulator [Alphaproteobacteria bacterium]